MIEKIFDWEVDVISKTINYLAPLLFQTAFIIVTFGLVIGIIWLIVGYSISFIGTVIKPLRKVACFMGIHTGSGSKNYDYSHQTKCGNPKYACPWCKGTGTIEQCGTFVKD